MDRKKKLYELKGNGYDDGESVTMCAVSKIESILDALDCQLWPCDGEDCEIDDCIHLNRFS